jgi:adhesin transport system outer membrane protein
VKLARRQKMADGRADHRLAAMINLRMGRRIHRPGPAQHQPFPAATAAGGRDKQQSLAAAKPLSQRLPGEEEAQTLGLEQAVRLAVDWHPSISEAIGTLYQQAEGINVAEAGYYPQIAGGIKGGYNSGNGSDASSQSVSISLKQMLYDFGKVSNAVEAAGAKAARSQASILLAIDQVGRDTAFAYVEVQRYQRLIDIARQQIQGVGGHRRSGKTAQRHGRQYPVRCGPGSVASRRRASRRCRNTRRNTRAGKRRLSNLLGRQSSPQVSDAFAPSLGQSCNAPVITDALPAVLQAAAQRTQAQAELAQAKAEAYPTLSLQPSFNQYLDNNYDESESGHRSHPGGDLSSTLKCRSIRAAPSVPAVARQLCPHRS